MYIRYTQPPADLYDWYEEYFLDEEEVDVKAGGGQIMTIGQMVYQLLTKLDWFSTLFPRIPVPIKKQIDSKIEQFSRINKINFNSIPSQQRVSPPATRTNYYSSTSAEHGGNRGKYSSSSTSDRERDRESRDLERKRREERRSFERREKERERDTREYSSSSHYSHTRDDRRRDDDDNYDDKQRSSRSKDEYEHRDKEKHKKKHKNRDRERSRSKDDRKNKEYYRNDGMNTNEYYKDHGRDYDRRYR